MADREVGEAQPMVLAQAFERPWCRERQRATRAVMSVWCSMMQGHASITSHRVGARRGADCGLAEASGRVKHMVQRWCRQRVWHGGRALAIRRGLGSFTAYAAHGAVVAWRASALLAPGGEYRLCWCAAGAGHCTAADDFLVDVGSLALRGPAPMAQARTCVSGRECEVLGLAGLHLSADDRLMVLQTCGVSSGGVAGRLCRGMLGGGSRRPEPEARAESATRADDLRRGEPRGPSRGAEAEPAATRAEGSLTSRPALQSRAARGEAWRGSAARRVEPRVVEPGRGTRIWLQPSRVELGRCGARQGESWGRR